MKKHVSLALLAAAAITAGALAAPAVAQDQSAAAAPAAPADASTSRVGAPPAGKGQIVFFRPSAAGFLLSFSVHDGDKGVVKLANNSYAVVPIEPGTHTFVIESEAKDTLTLEIEAGETYYVRQSMAMGLIVGHPRLSLADQGTFDAVKSLKLTKLTATDKHAQAADTTAAK
ncbi:MAG TPA: DUF2846 domain-containing protein [Caulobacteraceae bacterium]|jgi:hypothetical protein